jgi:hypothetical protein
MRLVLAVGLVVAVTGCADDGGPRLDAVAPAASARNGTVVLTGRRLCGEPADCARAAGAVQIGLELPTVKANVISYFETSAEIVIPPVTPVGPTELVVTVNERASNALSFEVLP